MGGHESTLSWGYVILFTEFFVQTLNFIYVCQYVMATHFLKKNQPQQVICHHQKIPNKTENWILNAATELCLKKKTNRENAAIFWLSTLATR